MKKIFKNIIIVVVIILITIISLWIYKFNYLANQDWYDVDWNKIKLIKINNI